jgi:carbon-monoxide dehydrogenase large subunit
MVSVTPDSGEISVDRYIAVDDVGNQINPKIVEGQIHGGITQGLGQALYEGAHYDTNGNLLSGSFQDYTVPKAFHATEMETDNTVTECPHNPLGVKGVGEAGTIAAPPAVVNAVVNALKPFDIEHLDMPISEEDIWQAINQ